MTDLILDPPSAVAVAKCLVARVLPTTVSSLDVDAYHPRPCAWEDFSRPELAAMLEDFHHGAGYDRTADRYRETSVQRFTALPASRQAALVRAAQYPEATR